MVNPRVDPPIIKMRPCTSEITKKNMSIHYVGVFGFCSCSVLSPTLC